MIENRQNVVNFRRKGVFFGKKEVKRLPKLHHKFNILLGKKR